MFSKPTRLVVISGIALGIIFLFAAVASAWTPVSTTTLQGPVTQADLPPRSAVSWMPTPVADDPLVHMPGTQPGRRLSRRRQHLHRVLSWQLRPGHRTELSLERLHDGPGGTRLHLLDHHDRRRPGFHLGHRLAQRGRHLRALPLPQGLGRGTLRPSQRLGHDRRRLRRRLVRRLPPHGRSLLRGHLCRHARRRRLAGLLGRGRQHRPRQRHAVTDNG